MLDRHILERAFIYSYEIPFQFQNIELKDCLRHKEAISFTIARYIYGVNLLKPVSLTAIFFSAQCQFKFVYTCRNGFRHHQLVSLFYFTPRATLHVRTQRSMNESALARSQKTRNDQNKCLVHMRKKAFEITEVLISPAHFDSRMYEHVDHSLNSTSRG